MKLGLDLQMVDVGVNFAVGCEVAVGFGWDLWDDAWGLVVKMHVIQNTRRL